MVEIVATDDVLGGEPRIAEHRVSVFQVAEMVVEGGHSPEYVADQLGLSLAEVYAALAYYYDNPDEMEAVRDRHRDLESDLEAASSGPAVPEQ